MKRNSNFALLKSIENIHVMRDFSKPLESCFGIKGFAYIRVYNDCRYFTIFNGYEDYIKKHVELVRSQDLEFQKLMRDALPEQPNFHLWHQKYDVMPMAAQLRKEYGICNAFSISYREKEYVEATSFWFGPEYGDRKDFFIQNSHLLLKFCNYFKIKAKDLLDSFSKGELNIYKDPFSISLSKEREEVAKKFIEEIDKNFCLVGSNNELVKLTQREQECILTLLQNKTAKEIGQTLNLSFRTVEHHITNVKKKLGVNYKRELLDMICEKDGTKLFKF